MDINVAVGSAVAPLEIINLLRTKTCCVARAARSVVSKLDIAARCGQIVNGGCYVGSDRWTLW